MPQWFNVLLVGKDMAVSCGITRESVLNLLEDSECSELDLIFQDGGLETFRRMEVIEDIYIHLRPSEEATDSPNKSGGNA